MLCPRKVRTKLYIHSYEHFIHTATAALPKGAPKYKPPYVKKRRRKRQRRSRNSVGHSDQSNRMLASSWASDPAAAASVVCCALEIITMMVTCHQFTTCHNDQSNRMLASSWASDPAAAASAVCCALEIITIMVTCHQFTTFYPPPPLLPGYTTDGWLLFRVRNAAGGVSRHVVSIQVGTTVTLSHHVCNKETYV